jgi:hypothetical protein
MLVEGFIEILDGTCKFLCACVHTSCGIISDCLAALVAEFELLLDEVIGAHELTGIPFPLLFNSKKARIVLMRLVVKLRIALEFVLKMVERVEVM